MIAEESRSQHENKAKAIERLRQAFFLRLRQELAAEELTQERIGGRTEYAEVFGSPPREGEEPRRLHLGRRDARYWPLVGVVLDVLQGCQAQVSTTRLRQGPNLS